MHNNTTQVSTAGLGGQTAAARVLLVDDHVGSLSALESLLVGIDANPVRANSAQDALRALLTADFAVLVLDVRMPEMDGFELARLIRQQRRHRDLPIIFVTGIETTPENLETAYSLGAVDFLSKPIGPEAFRSKIRTFVELYRYRRELEHRVAERTTELERTALSLQASERRLAAELATSQRLQVVSTRMIGEESPETLYEHILDAATAIMHSQYASIQMFYPERGPEGELRLLGFRGFNPEAAQFWEWVRPASESTCGLAIRTRERIIVSDVEKCDFMAGSEDLRTYLQTGIYAVQSTPLLSRSGRLLGMISTHWDAPHTPAGNDLRQFDVLARQAADLIERSQVMSEVRRLNDNLEQRVRERTASLEEMVRELDTFAYTVAHDLRAPLRAVHQYSDVLLEDCGDKLDPESRQNLVRIAQGAVRMDELIRDLLSYSRIARSDARLVAVDVRTALEAARASLEGDLRARNVRLEVQDNLPHVLADPVLLPQCIMNLLSNAIKFTPQEKTAQVRVSAERSDDHIRLVVEDRGIGIAREHQERLFRLFERLNPSAYPGTGVGLAIVKKAAERMNGRVGVESEPDKGSRFWIELREARA